MIHTYMYISAYWVLAWAIYPPYNNWYIQVTQYPIPNTHKAKEPIFVWKLARLLTYSHFDLKQLEPVLWFVFAKYGELLRTMSGSKISDKLQEIKISIGDSLAISWQSTCRQINILRYVDSRYIDCLFINCLFIDCLLFFLTKFLWELDERLTINWFKV